MHKILLLLSLTSLAATAQVKITKNIKQAMGRIDTNTIRSHVAYLADDRLKGRLPGTEGFQMAVDYVTAQMKEIGITPGGDNGGYTQKLVIRRSLVTNSSALAVLKDAKGNRDSLVFARDYTPAPHPLIKSASAEGKLVFAGYGVDIPGGYSDYTGIDVKGKIVVLVNGAPEGLQSTLTAHFSNAGNKMNTAFEKGAVGVISVNLNARHSSPTAPAIQRSA
jgi:hypothetical protein